MQTINISMPEELIKIVEGKVSSGLYSDASEVVSDAVRQLDSVAELLYQLKLDRLKAALAVVIAQVENGDVVQFSKQDIIDELNLAL